jgi:hypothetical protein
MRISSIITRFIKQHLEEDLMLSNQKLNRLCNTTLIPFSEILRIA